MPEIVLVVAKLGFLALLWVFVFTALGVLRRDLFGTRPARAAAAPRQAAPPRPKAKRGKTPHQLVVTAGALAGTKIALGTNPITIGRANDSTLVLTDDYASSRHARLVPHNGQWLVEDMGSTNGTYLDRTRVSTPLPGPVGAPIRIGKTVIELRS